MRSDSEDEVSDSEVEQTDDDSESGEDERTSRTGDNDLNVGGLGSQSCEVDPTAPESVTEAGPSMSVSIKVSVPISVDCSMSIGVVGSVSTGA